MPPEVELQVVPTTLAGRLERPIKFALLPVELPPIVATHPASICIVPSYTLP